MTIASIFNLVGVDKTLKNIRPGRNPCFLTPKFRPACTRRFPSFVVRRRSADSAPRPPYSLDGGPAAQRKSSCRSSSSSSSDCERFEYAAASCATLRKRERPADDKTLSTAVATGVDYDVCPYATFSVMQATGSPSSGRDTPPAATHHRRALGQTGCYGKRTRMGRWRRSMSPAQPISKPMAFVCAAYPFDQAIQSYGRHFHGLCRGDAKIKVRISNRRNGASFVLVCAVYGFDVDHPLSIRYNYGSNFIIKMRLIF